MDKSKIKVISVAGVDYRDYPDFCDAFIEEAEVDGVLLTEEELEELNDDSDFVYNAVMDYLY